MRPAAPLVTAVLLLATACSVGTSPDGSHAAGTATAPHETADDPPAGGTPAAGSGEPTSPTTGGAPVGTTALAARPHPVGTAVLELVDRRRGRPLRTYLYYPATTAGPDAPPAAGAFPLVLMAHGYRLPASGYAHLLSTVAAAGYVVGSPAFPRTSAEVGDGLRADITNQPGDLSFVADALTGEPRPGLPVIGPPDRVGAMGHSDGGLTVSAWAFGTRYRDPRVAAAVVMTGGTALFPTSYFTSPTPPLLAVHATGDETNPYSASTNLYAAAPADTDRFLLTVEGGSHLGPYMLDTPVPEVERAVVAFLDLELRNDPAGRDRLLAAGRVPGTTRIQAG